MIALRRDYTDIAMALETRSILDVHYDDSFGAGVSGEVYRGTFNGRNVAVKEFSNVSDPSIWTEIRLLSSLRSDHIVELRHVDINPNDQRVALVLESMSMNLRQRLELESMLFLAQKVRIALDVAKGVSFLHSQKVVYCDLKPDNVLLDEEDRVKLADFGISEHEVPDRESQMKGTVQYMAPELTGLPASVPSYASDVYAFGILLTELDANTGEVPYVNVGYESPYALWNQVRSGLRPALRDDCPLWFRELAVQCMAEAPSDRPTVPEIINTLEENFHGI